MPGDFAFAHCWAVLGDVDAAAEAAVAALRRAGRSRLSIAAHARYQALLAPEPPPPAPDTATPDDLAELAGELARTRSARERAVMDLRGRLDRGDVGRALGMATEAAARLGDEIGDSWDQDLDPQLLARLGPGDCPELAAILADHPTSTLADLAAAGPAVAAHVETCDVCADRRRAMVSVRTLFAQQRPPPTPAAVREAAGRFRRMRPMPAPPPLEPGRRVGLGVVAVVAVVAIAAAGTLGGVALGRRHRARAHRVAALVNVPSKAGLALTLTGATADVTNRSSRTLRWRASADASWLQLTPSSGTLAPGAAATSHVRTLPSAPEGRVRTAITITADDGSAAAAIFTTDVERPPDLAASADRCAITATADDTSGVATVALHWTDKAGAHEGAFVLDGSMYRASVPESDPLTWWVTATDSRGNQAQTPPSQLTC